MFILNLHLVHTVLISIYVIFVKANDDINFLLPDELSIGAGSSAYQIEGAWNVSDKGESLWDRYTHTSPDKIFKGQNGDIACDSYHKYKEDILLLRKMKLNHYRFSLSWSRILPTGYSNIVSKEGVRYYNELINELMRNGIEPYVTIYHFDHPQIFQDIGGWTNEAMVDLFGDYARVVFKEFGDRVKIFSTINEPNFCNLAYYTGIFAPGLKLGKHAEYLCIHNVLKAHARAYHIYDEEFRAQQNGKVGITLGCSQFYPKNKNDNKSAEIAFQYDCNRYAAPIFTEKADYPEIVKQRIAENSYYEGLQRSRLPTFSKYWRDYIRGTADYLGLNHYTSHIVEPAPKPNNTIYLNDDGLLYSFDPTWPVTASERFKMVPAAFGDLLRKIKKNFGNPPVYIMENGVPDYNTLNDTERIEYLYSYMDAMLTAIKRDECNVKAYTVWSLLDNFEWSIGYSERFGLIHVDFNSINRTRTLKKSATWLTKILTDRKLQKPII